MVQLFLNIFLNAAEAMPQGGRIHAVIQQNAKREAEIIITDTGPGISVHDMKKIYNPFFTTKNQPLGLGLPVSRRIVEAHQGRLLVGSRLKNGARVVVTLPYIPECSNIFKEHRSLN
jgi:signal transduction histidine kinase